METATTSSTCQLSHSSLGLVIKNVQTVPNFVKVCCVLKIARKPKSFSLRIQCFQSQPLCQPKSVVPVVYAAEGDDDNFCSIQSVSSDTSTSKVPENFLHEAEDLPTSALAVADVIGTGFTAVRKAEDSTHLLSAASAEFLALCTEQLGLCEELIGPAARFTVYIRPAESYSTGQLEFHCMAVYPSQQEELLVLKQTDSLVSVTLAEAELIKQEVVEVASISAIILPMVKDSFLIGLLVVEGVAKPRKSAKVKPVRPVWPPRKSTSEVIAALSKQQLTELAKVARSLALACVMDQRALLLQKSTLQKGDQIDGLLEQAQGPLQAVRTLGQLLLPHLKRGEISRDFVEDIMVQGARMKDVLQQLHNVAQSGPNLFQPSEGLEGVYPKELSEPDLVPQGYVDDCDVTQKQGLLPAAYLEGEDFEAPMPPLALAPLPQYDITRPCDVAEVLRLLGQAANGLANQRGQKLQITSCSPLYAAVDADSLRRACSHLLETALQHTPKGGYVRTDAMRAPGGGVLIVIEDNGTDILMQGRGSGPAKPGWRGTDLEHALVEEDVEFIRDIVELQLGGVLRIQSPHLQNALPGAGGSHVEIWLPAVPNSDDCHD